jgi:hypothetical protein
VTRGAGTGRHARKIPRRRTAKPRGAPKGRRSSTTLAGDLDAQVAALTRELTEAREQQTATSEVLKVISSSPGELEPVFQAMLANAMRVCEAKFGILYAFTNGQFRAISWVRVPSRYAEFVKQSRVWGPETGLGQLSRPGKLFTSEMS